MKYIQTIFISCAMSVAPCFDVSAQAADENGKDTLTVKKDPLVQVAFRKVAPADLLGGVSVIDMEEVTKKNYNTSSMDHLEGYVGGWNGNSLWGMDADNDFGYLVLVDGIPRDANNVQPTEIAQITFLKSAQAVILYGSRAAKGAVLITTKRGKEGDLSVSLRANTGYNVVKRYPEYLSSAEYMTLYNEAQHNDNPDKAPTYSAEQIYNAGSGLNPYRYPNIDYYSSEYLKKAYNRTDVTAEISGGGKRARYYNNVSYYRQGDLFKFGEAENNSISRLNVRGNVDVDINRYFSAYINANATFYDSKTAKGDYWTKAATARPNYPLVGSPLIPLDYIDPNAANALALVGTSSNIIDGKYFLVGSTSEQTNSFSEAYSAGSSKWTSRQFQFDTGVNIDLGGVLKGLSFNTKFAVDYATSYTTSFDNKYAVFNPTWSNVNGKDVIADLEQINNDEKTGNQNISNSSDKQTIAFSAQFNYIRTLKEVHNLSAMLIASGFQQTKSKEYHRIGNANLAFQAGYNYKSKYYVDFSSALVHSAKLEEGHREAFSPSVTLGWRLSKENFLAGSSIVDDLMFSVSGSIVNEDMDIKDGDNRFYLYKSVWTQQDGYSWYDGSSGRYTISKRGENADLTFIKRKELSASIRGVFLKNLISANASFFYISSEGYLATPTNYPSHLKTGWPSASFVPLMNCNNNRRIGFDFSVNVNKRFGEVDLSLGLNGTYYDTKATKRDELYTDGRKREGNPVDGIWGYKSAGLFQSEEEIAAWATQKIGDTPKPGDIKYIDQNGDKVINEEDQVYLGKNGWYGSPFTLGVNFTAKWRNLTLFALGTGSFGAYGIKNDENYYWIAAEKKYSAVVRDRWTPETAATASYPRLTAGSGSNNFVTSDYWMYKSNRFDLAKVQLTYDLPKRLFESSFIHGVSAYVSGDNLLTFAKERKLMEMNIGKAPHVRFYNVGLKAIF